MDTYMVLRRLLVMAISVAWFAACDGGIEVRLQTTAQQIGATNELMCPSWDAQFEMDIEAPYLGLNDTTADANGATGATNTPLGVVFSDYDAGAIARGVARIYMMSHDQSTFYNINVPGLDAVADVEAMSAGLCGIEDATKQIDSSSRCWFFADVGSSRLRSTGSSQVEIARSVLIYKEPTLEQVILESPLEFVGKVGITTPPDRDASHLGKYSNDISAFAVFPGLSSQRRIRGNISTQVKDEGDWFFVTKSVSGDGSGQSALYPTHIYRVAAEEWRSRITADGSEIIDLGTSQEDFAPVGALPIPYLLAVHFKSKEVDLNAAPYSDFLAFLTPELRAKVVAIYNGETVSESVEEEVFEGLEDRSVREMINPEAWVEIGGNPFGYIVVTDMTFAENGRKWYLQTYGGLVEGSVNLTADLPQLSVYLTEDSTRFVDVNIAFQHHEGQLMQMEAMALVPGRYYADDEDRILYTTEVNDAQIYGDYGDAMPALWSLTCHGPEGVH